MINIRIAEENDKKKIFNLFDEGKIEIANLDTERLNNSMVVCDGEKIIGYSNYIEIPNTEIAFIDTLVIKREYQGQYMGDGLVKSLLNLADKRHIKKVYVIRKNSNYIFYKKVGLAQKKLKVSEDILKYMGNDLEVNETIEVLEAVLPDFFDKACKSRR